ncbi:MAG: carbohydrate kinase family protein [Microbacterium sp.]
MTHSRPSADRLPQPDVLVVSRLVLDDLHLPDGSVSTGIPGGSGFWAAFGAALVADEVALTCKVGGDADPYRELLERLGVRTDGFVRVERPTSRTIVTYPRGEERHERPLPDWEAHVAMRTMAEEFPESVASPHGYYVFRGWHPGFWEGLLPVVRERDVPLLWEIPASICTPAERPRITEVLRDTGILSLNLDEASALCGGTDEDDLLDGLHRLGAPVVAMRRGARGAVVSDGTRIVEALPPEGSVPVDVTGAGNAFSGAFLAEHLRSGGDIGAATSAAMAASAVAISRIGPPHDRTEARQQWAAFRSAVQITEKEKRG